MRQQQLLNLIRGKVNQCELDLEKQRQCKEKYKNYSFLSKEEIIKKGDEYHRMIKNFLLVSNYLNK